MFLPQLYVVGLHPGRSHHPGLSASRGACIQRGVCIQGDWADPPGLPRVGFTSGRGVEVGIPRDTVNKQTVRIPLECILVISKMR